MTIVPRKKQQYLSNLECFIYRRKGNDIRYVLGYRDNTQIKQQRYLICIGINPSTADNTSLDKTTCQVENMAQRYNCTGWIMLNLFPQRATDFKEVKSETDFNVDKKLRKAYCQNLHHIESILSNYMAHILYIWCAWGGQIKERNYFWKSFDETYQIINKLNLNNRCYCSGETKKDGHPRHPSRLSNDSSLRYFPIDVYHEKWRDKYK